MVVRVRFGRGPVIARRKGKNRRLATLASTLFTIASISCASMGAWRIGNDVNLVAGDFVFTQGFLSHWQVWVGAAAAVQYASWLLRRHVRLADAEDAETPETELPAENETGARAATANI
jgi:hypothetical protein